MRNSRGVALIITLIAAVALLVVLIAVVGSFSLSNRKVAGNKSIELKAQFAAESGAEQSIAILAAFGELLTKTRVDLSAGDPAVDKLATRLAALCYGTTSPGASTLKKLKKAIRGKSSFTCTPKLATLKKQIEDKTITDAQLGKRWMVFFLDYIDRSVYEAQGTVNPSDSTTLYQEKVFRYWGQILRGTQANLQRVIESTPEVTVRYRIATDSRAGIVPIQLTIGKGEIELLFGSLTGKEQLVSIGEVLDSSGNLLARRAIQIGNEGESRLSLVLKSPSYAWFAFFFDQQKALSGKNMIVFTDKTVIDGPVHANDYLAFERGSRPWFGGPVSSAGPSRHGTGIRAYWRETLAGTSGYETPPPGVDGEHWWNLVESSPEFAIATDALGKPICYDPVTKKEELCEHVDADGDGQPDPPWEYKRDVNWDRAEIKLPGSDAIDSFRAQALSDGIYIDPAEFCSTPSARWVKAGDPPPTACVGKYLTGGGRNRILLEAKGDEQVIRIYLTKVKGWKYVKTKPAGWFKSKETCPTPTPPGTPSPSPPGTPGGGGGGVERPLPVPELWKYGYRILFPISGFAKLRAQSPWADPTGAACSGKPKPACKSGCTCIYTCFIARDRYKIETETEYIEFRYSESDPHIKVASKKGPVTPVQYTSGPFNGIIFTEIDDFFVSGPPKADPADPPIPAIAEFAQISLASPKDFHITGDLAYAKPACTKTPHRDTADADGDGDTDEVVDRCTEKDYKDPAPNLLGIYGRNIHLNPQGVWANEGADLTVHAVLMAYDGEIQTRHVQHCFRGELGRFKLLGGLIQKKIGPLNWRRDCGGEDKLLGYRSALTYDRRMLEGLAPPGFPRFVEGKWDADLGEVEAGTPGFWRQVPGN